MLTSGNDHLITIYQQAFYEAFILVLIVNWSPFKSLAYLSPIITLFWIIVRTMYKVTLRRAVIWFVVWLLFILLHVLVNRYFVFSSSLITMFTFASFCVAFSIPQSHLSNPELVHKCLKILQAIIIIEAFWGITQGAYNFAHTRTFDSSNGDVVTGTIGFVLHPHGSFSTVMYAANMAFMLLAIFPYVMKREFVFAFVIGCIALLLASVIHLIIMLFIGLIVAFILYKPATIKRSTLIPLVFLFGIVPVVAFFLLRGNLLLVKVYSNQILHAQVPRSQMIITSVTDMPRAYPYMPWIGLGPGQFSSRGALIGTGMFFGTPLNPITIPYLPIAISQPQSQYLIDLWMLSVKNIYYGSTQQPFSSALAIYTEFGLPILLAITIYTFSLVFSLKKKAAPQFQRYFAVSIGASILLLFMLGFQENYWEVPQAILIGIMLMKVLHANLSSIQDSPNGLPER